MSIFLLIFFFSQNDLDFQSRRADHLSHFILRLAYCRSEDLRRWFLIREMEWFKLKFLEQTSESIKKFLDLNNLTYSPISNDEKDEIKNDLIISTPGLYTYKLKHLNINLFIHKLHYSSDSSN